MTNRGTFLTLCSAMLFVALCTNAAKADDMHTAPGSNAGGPCKIGTTPAPCVTNLIREDVATGIGHYSWTQRVGTGANDVIGMDRVTKEFAPWLPKASAKAVFLAHGDTLTFRSSWLIGPVGGSQAKSSSVASYLASHDVDVWGITQRDRMVPASVTDTSFMQNWNMMNTYVPDTQVAMYTARLVRLATGSGYGQLQYVGWSRGGQLGYVLAQVESQMPSSLRSMKTMTIVDVPLKSNDPSFIATICTGPTSVVAGLQAARAAGVYSDDTGSLLQVAGQLAIADPNGITPLGAAVPPLTGLTNQQVVLLFGGATHNFNPYVPWYHLVGSDLTSDDAAGFPLSLLFTDLNVFNTVLPNVAAHESNGVMLQGAQVICDSSGPLDDHLHDVTIPTFYIGANGGFGAGGVYTTTLLGTSAANKQTMLINQTGNQFTDFGHDDVFRSPLAVNLVFVPLLNWVNGH